MPTQKWIERQVAALVAAGIDVPDATEIVQRAVDMLPNGEDEDAWIPPPMDLRVDPSTNASLSESRTSWYASPYVDSKYRRLLDARAE